MNWLFQELLYEYEIQYGQSYQILKDLNADSYEINWSDGFLSQ